MRTKVHERKLHVFIYIILGSKSKILSNDKRDKSDIYTISDKCDNWNISDNYDNWDKSVPIEAQ
jgi:hypothetical protein